MFFRNATLFRFPASVREDLDVLPERLSEHVLKPVGALELSSRGFVSPFGDASDELSYQVGDCLLLALGGEDKILPSSVVNKAVSQRCEQFREAMNREPDSVERRSIRNEVLAGLLPRAFAKPARVLGYIDMARGWLVVDTTSRGWAEAFVNAIRDALGSFPAIPASSQISVRGKLTDWLVAGAQSTASDTGTEDVRPAQITLGDEFELLEPQQGGAIAKFRHQECDAHEIDGHLEAGKQCSRLALALANRLSLILSEDLVLRKVRFDDAIVDDLDAESFETAEDLARASFVLMNGAMAEFLGILEQQFGVVRPSEDN